MESSSTKNGVHIARCAPKPRFSIANPPKPEGCLSPQYLSILRPHVSWCLSLQHAMLLVHQAVFLRCVKLRGPIGSILSSRHKHSTPAVSPHIHSNTGTSMPSTKRCPMPRVSTRTNSLKSLVCETDLRLSGTSRRSLVLPQSRAMPSCSSHAFARWPERRARRFKKGQHAHMQK